MLTQRLLDSEYEDLVNIQKYGFVQGSLIRLFVDKVQFQLFEGTIIQLDLSERGFQIEKTEPLQSYQGKTYESIDGLLSELSPQYRTNLTTLLSKKLANLV